MTKWVFELNAVAKLVSGETGVIVGRAEYTNSNEQYLVRYTAGDGRLTEGWWRTDAFVEPEA